MTNAPVKTVPGSVGIIDGPSSKGLGDINPNAEQEVLNRLLDKYGLPNDNMF